MSRPVKCIHSIALEADVTLVQQELDNLMQRMEEPLARLNYEIEEHKRKHEVELRTVGKTVSELHHSRDTLEQHNEAIERYVPVPVQYCLFLGLLHGQLCEDSSRTRAQKV